MWHQGLVKTGIEKKTCRILTPTWLRLGEQSLLPGHSNLRFFQWTLRFWRWVFLFLVSRWPRLWCRWGSQFTVLCNSFKHVFLDWTFNTKYYHLLFAHHEQWCPSVVHGLMQTEIHGLLHGELSLLMTLHLDSRQLQGLRLTCALPRKHWKHKTPRANCHEPFAASPWPPFFQRRHNLQTAFRGRLVDGSAGWLTSSSGSSSLPQGAISLRLVGHLRSCYPVHLKRMHFIQVTTSDKSQSARAARSNIYVNTFAYYCDPMWVNHNILGIWIKMHLVYFGGSGFSYQKLLVPYLP